MRNKQDYKKIVEKFAEATEKSFAARLTGNWRENNKWVKRQVQAFQQVIEANNEAREELLTLLNHQNPVIAKSAAVFSLKYATEQSIAILTRISKEPGILGFEAQQALQRWKEGSWQLE